MYSFINEIIFQTPELIPVLMAPASLCDLISKADCWAHKVQDKVLRELQEPAHGAAQKGQQHQGLKAQFWSQQKPAITLSLTHPMKYNSLVVWALAGLVQCLNYRNVTILQMYNTAWQRQLHYKDPASNSRGNSSEVISRETPLIIMISCLWYSIIKEN